MARAIGGALLAWLAFFVPTPATLAQDPAFTAYVKDAAEPDLAGEEAVQRAVRDLVVAEKPEFEARKAERLARCLAIPEKEYSTGLIFNPSGYATLFHRSGCLQRLALDERDPLLCDQVRERRSWIFDGSGTSPENCRALVAARIGKDDQEAAAKEFETIHRLVSMRFARNGNGRDFDLTVVTEGSFAGSYELEVALASPGLGDPVRIHKNVYGYGATNEPRHIWLDRGALAAALGADFATREFAALAMLRIAEEKHRRFLYQRIPTALRSSRLKATIRFADLPPWQPEAFE